MLIGSLDALPTQEGQNKLLNRLTDIERTIVSSAQDGSLLPKIQEGVSLI